MIDSIASGAAGAVALTLAHEATRCTVADAPRMDVLGKRALAAGLRAADVAPPGEPAMHAVTLAGDLASNGAYYALVGLGGADGAVTRGALLGLAAGLGAVFLPGPLGLGTAPSRRTSRTALMTVGLYALGGLVAGATFGALADRRAGR
ncbi:hypothetical protein GobsT_73200 [Gemmata obscuriglobus]|uniref:Uncharacterized protein n=1 Tax=Gemmata obscuriglobus TaxID=114 RepID=A0A2Z3H9Q7_9BACT|nr:hypothetical protein [Gemmata obscuriglobus]AWM41611.1 hypothetical protein C1280_34500 [Gemmata obscuriglobus]QEG32465.1 hypothetical protein GobsT_73200 [Gemmata obscuriglobus]VTS11821.1 Uncharacterized protein OS=Nitrolancea hollandica Lb GN=NITHO_3970009 PE=4 SV=1 [Gemmata obscuriglobus UQM 2246]